MNLELQILSILRNSDGFLMPLDTVVAEVQLRGRQETASEIATALRNLDATGQTVGIANQDAPGGSKWKITDHGKARLTEANL
jgi:hypothetical protein